MIASAVRTPIGSFQGSLADVPAPKLGATVVEAAVERAGIQYSESQIYLFVMTVKPLL